MHTVADDLVTAPLLARQVWELFGRFLANETFAKEMDISLVPLNESDIPHVESNPKLKDGLQRPVRPICDSAQAVNVDAIGPDPHTIL